MPRKRTLTPRVCYIYHGFVTDPLNSSPHSFFYVTSHCVLYGISFITEFILIRLFPEDKLLDSFKTNRCVLLNIIVSSQSIDSINQDLKYNSMGKKFDYNHSVVYNNDES